MSSALVTSSFRSDSTTCGLWMMGPSVTAGADRSAVSTARRTPKQKPACLASTMRDMETNSHAQPRFFRPKPDERKKTIIRYP